jgi:hypothetical protein
MHSGREGNDDYFLYSTSAQIIIHSCTKELLHMIPVLEEDKR